jgi:hypothetical protein
MAFEIHGNAWNWNDTLFTKEEWLNDSSFYLAAFLSGNMKPILKPQLKAKGNSLEITVNTYG